MASLTLKVTDTPFTLEDTIATAQLGTLFRSMMEKVSQPLMQIMILTNTLTVPKDLMEDGGTTKTAMIPTSMGCITEVVGCYSPGLMVSTGRTWQVMNSHSRQLSWRSDQCNDNPASSIEHLGVFNIWTLRLRRHCSPVPIHSLFLHVYTVFCTAALSLSASNDCIVANFIFTIICSV